jgi:capsular polysaccharide biosynthesis protein
MNQPKNTPPVRAGSDQIAQRTQNNKNNEIDLVELFFRLLAAWKLIAALCLLGALSAFGITRFLMTPQYKATSTIYVVSRKDSAINMADLQIGTALTQDYIKVFSMWEVHEEVISNLNLPYSYGYMKKHLSVTNTTNTRMLDIGFTSPDPKEAADVANEYAKVASAFIAETMSTDKPNIVSVALEPSNPVSPSMTRNVVLGFLFGAALSAGIVFIQMILDDKIKTAEDIRRYTGLTNLAIVPKEDIKDNTGINGRKKTSRGREQA